MYRVALVALLVVAASARTFDDDLKLYNDFKETFGRKHLEAGVDTYHFNCFRQNLINIDRQNADPLEQALFAVNQFTDMCPEDFKVFHNLQLQNNTEGPLASLYNDAEIAAAAGKVDWRKKGAVTPIKNQGHCGSCWSFGASGNLEGAWFLAGNKLVGLSEEELVQCDHIAANGCQGAQNLVQSYQWIIKNGGIDSEADYPYTSGQGVTGTCNEAKTKKDVAKIKSYLRVASNEDQMATWTAKNGPLQIGVDALSWMNYHSGIMTNCNGRQLDHSVLIVGYDDTNSPPYWIIKNSWGTGWGISGYLRLEKGTDQCGITASPCSGLVK